MLNPPPATEAFLAETEKPITFASLLQAPWSLQVALFLPSYRFLYGCGEREWGSHCCNAYLHTERGGPSPQRTFSRLRMFWFSSSTCHALLRYWNWDDDLRTMATTGQSRFSDMRVPMFCMLAFMIKQLTNNACCTGKCSLVALTGRRQTVSVALPASRLAA